MDKMHLFVVKSVEVTHLFTVKSVVITHFITVKSVEITHFYAVKNVEKCYNKIERGGCLYVSFSYKKII